MRYTVGMERWLPVVGWEGRYDVSDEGRIRSWVGRTIREPVPALRATALNPLGYRMVILRKGPIRQGRGVHRLVAEAFIPNPDGLAEVHHINSVRDDNRVSNLEWITVAENRRRRRKPINVYQVLRDRITELEAEVERLKARR